MSQLDILINDLAENWRRSGVAAGDTLLVHSAIKRTLLAARHQGIPLSPEHILESFLRAVGKEGTLLLPLFNFDFTTTQNFDLHHTPSQMGAMTEAARLHPKSIRTGHPIYSFAVIGAAHDVFQGIDNQSGYGADSPFGVLHKLDGKIAVLDLPDQHSMTFYHYVEEMHGVPYRYFKAFSGSYTDLSGIQRNKTYTLFVRDVERDVRTHVNPAGEMMWEAGLYQGDKPKEGSGLRTIRATKMYDFVADLIQNGRAEGTLFKYGDKNTQQC